jgi:hypothetical protein
MACYLIGCKLTSPGRDYRELFDAVENLGDAFHCLDASWAVNTQKTAAEIRDELKRFINQNDDLLVAELTGRAAWRGAGTSFSTRLPSVLSQQRRRL